MMTALKYYFKKVLSTVFLKNSKNHKPKNTETSDLQLDHLRAFLMENRISDEFSPFFEDKVMQKIKEANSNDLDAFADSLAFVFKPVALTATIIVVLLIGLGLSGSDSISLDNPGGVQQPALENIIEKDIAQILE